MQSPDWYFHRLRAMTPRECAWRVASVARDLTDRVRLPLGGYPSERETQEAAEALSRGGPPRLCDVHPGEWRDAPAGRPERLWHDRVAERARRLIDHRVDIFGREYDLGSPIDWNRDVVHQRTAPLRFAAAIDYRNVDTAGDAKIVWEPNRHQHLLVLARAYRATGDRAYAAAVLEQLTSWLDQCPFGHGMNWRSPLELAIRVVNWTFALDFIRDSGVPTREMWIRILHAIHLHVWDIARKYSRGSSANNHVIGEAVGVFVASCYFDALPRAAQCRDEAFAILCREIQAQTNSDGGSREQAFAYHLFAAELFLVAALVGRTSGIEFPQAYWRRLESMLSFAAALAEGGPPPAFGDSDDGYVLDLGGTSALGWLCGAGAVLFEQPSLKAVAPTFQEPARWLLGRSSEAAFAAVPKPAAGELTSRAFPESGYYVLQCGDPASEDTVSAVVDCGPLGFGALAAHGHADALSVVVRAFGREVLVDPGTFDYFSYPSWRTYFRSTRAHNTVCVDSVDQSVQLGGFLWGGRAHARCLAWQPSANGGLVVGEHDGYRRLRDPLVHRRRVDLDVDLDRSTRVMTIRDELICSGAHDVEVLFHFGPSCRIIGAGASDFEIDVDGHVVRLVLDPRLRMSSLHGPDIPVGGWRSRRYHHREAITTLVGAVRVGEQMSLETRITFLNSGTVLPRR